MKRFLILFLVLCVTAGFAAAEDEEEGGGGIGLTVGLEFGVKNINKAYGDNMIPYLKPMLIYDSSFIDGALDVYAEIDYTFGFTREENEKGKKVFPQSIYLDLSVGYNLKLGEASILSFIVENEFDELIIAPRSSVYDNLTGIFTPAVKFSQDLSFGNLYALISTPITYFDRNSDIDMGLDFTAGWKSNFGLGLEAKVCSYVFPSYGYSSFEATISYETGSMYAEVETIFYSDITYNGVTITPEFDYSFKNFTFYVKSEFAGIGISGGRVIITPALGVKYSF